ncbi:MAG: hypothetical protein Q8930_07370 [Bacillota bacterium]|nr:hypothetical protein [Bacillota bacterium]
MKVKAILLSLAVAASLFAGCSSKPATTTTTTTPAATTTTPEATKTTTADAKKTDAVATASVVDTNAAFEKALTADGGHYVIATLKDMTFDKELTVDGDFKTNKKDKDGKLIVDAQGNPQIQRKIGLYTQDDKFVVTGRFTLTAPKITFNSNYGSIEHGKFVGDVYVAGTNFKLVNAEIDGNIYFLNQAAKDTFKIADVTADKDKVATKVTGQQTLKTN